MKNLIALEIPAEIAQQVEQKLTEARQMLAPFLVALTNEQRKTTAKMGDKTIPFVSKVLEYSKSNPSFAPPYMDVTGMEVDVKAAETLTTLLRSSEQLTSNLDDTSMLSGSDAYIAALGYYNSVRHAAKNNVPAAKEIYEDLRKRFPGRVRKAAVSTTV
ncbi:hypothetical protein [Chitinophaga barathri]|uniref:Uncharacterized protein n=1 Tax=Chitinophaga barathri TaxID=1647451 RepID=A0A3N4MJE2_9BACT|nr:hypothetical protein [Chitinophaga barathri]RPD41957.1 hypothetical protein EG028_07310 [Chitinophaga barathri]